MRKRAVALVLAGCAVLTACTDVTKPASPTATPSAPDSASAPGADEPSAEPTPEPVRNPYEGGAERDWSVELPGQPTAVVYDRQSGTLIAALAEARGTQLHAFSVSSSGRTLPIWTYDIPDATDILAMDASSGSVFVSVGDAGAGSGDAGSGGAGAAEANAGGADAGRATASSGKMTDAVPSDFIVLGARSGAEELRWTRAHVLDTEVPWLVGAYDAGAGIVRLGRDSVLAAVIDSGGRVIEDERLFTADAQVRLGIDIVDTGIPGTAGTTFVTYPGLSKVSGDKCWSVTDGIVCVGAGQVVEYDARANLRRETPLRAGSAGEVFEVAGMDPDVTARELAEALAERADAAGVDSAGEGAGGSGSGASGGAGTGESDSADSDVPEADKPAANARDRATVAVLADGRWLTDIPAGAEPFARGAPFAQAGNAIVNLVTGEALVEDALVGEGHSADMFFEWDGSALHYLRPLGR